MSANAPFDFFHAYVYATASWYFIRGFCRIAWPDTVYHWFEANSTARDPTSLELYNIRTDAIGLVALAFLTVALARAFNPTSTKTAASTDKPAAKAAIGGTIAHHLGTAIFAYQQWANPDTTTGAMLLGWAYSSLLAALGGLALVEVDKIRSTASSGDKVKKAA